MVKRKILENEIKKELKNLSKEETFCFNTAFYLSDLRKINATVNTKEDLSKVYNILPLNLLITYPQNFFIRSGQIPYNLNEDLDLQASMNRYIFEITKNDLFNNYKEINPSNFLIINKIFENKIDTISEKRFDTESLLYSFLSIPSFRAMLEQDVKYKKRNIDNFIKEYEAISEGNVNSKNLENKTNLLLGYFLEADKNKLELFKEIISTNVDRNLDLYNIIFENEFRKLGFNYKEDEIKEELDYRANRYVKSKNLNSYGSNKNSQYIRDGKIQNNKLGRSFGLI